MKTQTRKILILTAIGLLIFKLTKAGKTMSAKFINFKDNEQPKLQALEAALIKAGLNMPQLNFALAQLLFETGRFTNKSAVATLNNNYSGIKWINKPYQVAERGSATPPSENVGLSANSPLRYYAKFKDANAWAKDYVRILNLRSKPIQATNIDEFALRLGKNGYYDTTKSNSIAIYTKGLKNYLVMFK